MLKYQMSFFKGQLEAIESIFDSFFPQHTDDKRFNEKAWQEHSFFVWLKEAYFTYTKWVESVLETLPKDEFTAIEIKKINFIIIN
jgi:hypothetical protein